MVETETHTGMPAPDLAVIGAGFGRTGTASLKEALEILGYGPCDHMAENFEHLERFALWREAVQRKQRNQPIDWRPLLGNYRAIVDWPGVYFWRELLAAHPKAKVILTVRDPDRWYDSSLTTIYGMRDRSDESPWAWVLMRLVGLVKPALREGFQVVNDVVWHGTFSGRFADREHALRIFDEHNTAVMDAVPADQLLVFDVKEGWAPLCAFLGVPVPEDEPFPHVNDADAFRQRMRVRLTSFLKRLIKWMAIVGIGLTTLIWIVRRMQRR